MKTLSVALYKNSVPDLMAISEAAKILTEYNTSEDDVVEVTVGNVLILDILRFFRKDGLIQNLVFIVPVDWNQSTVQDDVDFNSYVSIEIDENGQYDTDEELPEILTLWCDVLRSLEE